MDKEWLKTYYKGLGWSEQRISEFLKEAEINEEIKVRDVKRLEFKAQTVKE